VAAYIVRRVLISLGVLLVASFLLYVMVASSGDPLAALRARPGITPATIDATARSLGLDHPIPVRYWTWLTGVLHGDWGTSVALGQARAEVLPAVGRALWVTIRLVVIAELLALLVGGAVGALAALKQYSITDYVATTLAFVLFAMPVFCIGIILKVYGIQLNLVLIHVFGERWLTTAGPPASGFTGSPGEVLFKFTGAYILPTIALAAISFAAYSRFQRASMLETMRSDYVRTARAKGLSERQVVLRHALRNAMLPVTTYFAYNFGAVFGGAIVTEQVFGWNGMGSLLVRSIEQYDPNMLMGWLIVTATIVILFNLIADIAYSYLDPRIRLG
jgi:peptide/nickel transport system permease protein